MGDLSKLAHDATERHQVARALGTLSACYSVQLYEMSDFHYKIKVDAEDATTTHDSGTLADAVLVMVREMLRIERDDPERAAAARTKYAELMTETVQRKGT